MSGEAARGGQKVRGRIGLDRASVELSRHRHETTESLSLARDPPSERLANRLLELVDVP